MMALALAQVVIVGACTSTGESPTAPTSGESFRLEDFVASASVGGSQGQLRSGPAPTTGGGPAVTVSGNQVVVNGGVADINVVAGSPISRLSDQPALRDAGWREFRAHDQFVRTR